LIASFTFIEGKQMIGDAALIRGELSQRDSVCRSFRRKRSVFVYRDAGDDSRRGRYLRCLHNEDDFGTQVASKEFLLFSRNGRTKGVRYSDLHG
jgi:hypothetical protein